MVKLKKLSFHCVEDVPDHILEEMTKFSTDLALLMQPMIDSVSPNIAMSAMTWVHAVFLKKMISDESGELEKASKMYAYSFIKNVEVLIKNMKKDEKSG